MKKLTKKQEPIYAFSAFGPNLIMIIISVYIINAFSIKGFEDQANLWTFAGKTIVAVTIFSILMTIARIIDGMIDVPLASLTDNLRTKWGRRRPAIVLGAIPMVLSYVMLINPIEVIEGSILNTIWAAVALIIFFCSYTLVLVTYYATFSEITESSASRVRLSTWKAIFDTIGYSLAYALIPLIVGFGINIINLAHYVLPLFLTILIPIFMIKEPSTLRKDQSSEDQSITEVSMKEKVRITWKNKDFMIWMLVYGVFFFGLQMFLSGQNVLASGAMGLEGWQTAVMNAAAFAPVPLMLLIYNRVMKKKGFRVAFQTAILSFLIAMICFSIAYVPWIESQMIRLYIGITGATIGSYGIGAFFSSPYIISSQIAYNDQKKTGKNNGAMFFAIQGLINAIIGAISTGLIWLNLKEVEIQNEPHFGVHLMTVIVSIACLVAFFLAFKLKHSYQENEA